MKHILIITLLLIIATSLAGVAGCQDIKDVVDEAKDVIDEVKEHVPDMSGESPESTPGADKPASVPPETQTPAPDGSVASGRPWEDIDCSLSPLPAPPDFTGAVTGWTLMNVPLPDDMIFKELKLVKGDVGNCYALGSHGTLLRLDDSPLRWTPMDTGTHKYLGDMAPVGGWYSIIVGEAGLVLSYSMADGEIRDFEGPFDDMPEDQRPSLFYVWGDNSEDFYVFGDGVFYHYAPLPPSHADYDPLDTEPKWQYVTPPVTVIPGDPHAPNVRDVWVNNPDSVFALVYDPLQGHYTTEWDGREWGDPKEIPTNALVRGIWGLSHNDVFAVGVGGLIMHFDGVEWNPFNDFGLDLFNSYTDIWGTAHSNLFIIGDYGELLHFDGEYWTKMDIPTTSPLTSIWGWSTGLNGVFVSGSNGEIMNYIEVPTAVGEGIAWVQSTPVLNAVTSHDLTNYFVGSAGDLSLIRTYVSLGSVTEWTPAAGDLKDAFVKDGKLYTVGWQSVGGTFGIGVLVKDLDTGEDFYFEDSEEGACLLPASIAVDDEGAAYVGGQTSGPVGGQTHSGFFIEREGELSYTPVAMDAFIIKYSPQGERRWVRVFGNPDSNRYPFNNLNGEKIINMEFNASGELVVAGQTATPDVFALPSSGSSGNGLSVNNIGRTPRGPQEPIENGYGFVLRFTADGDFSGGRGWGTPGYTGFAVMEMTADGYVYLAGTSDYAGLIDEQIGNGYSNILVMKLNADLTPVWTRFITNPGMQVVNDVALDGDGGLYLVGRTTDSIGGRLYSDRGDIYVMQMSADGVILGSQMLGGVENDYGSLVVTDPGGRPVIWAHIESPSIEGFDEKVNTAFWYVGEIPYDPYVECRQ